MKFSELLALSEASTGYVGGTYVDEMPHLTLEECVSSLTESILADQISLYESNMKQNDSLVEATLSGGNIDTLVEMSFQSIKDKVSAFFQKILKFFKSIIAKLKLQIDKIRMSGQQLYSKYKNDPRLRTTDYSDLTFEGYKFSDKEIFTAAAKYDTDAKALVKETISNDASSMIDGIDSAAADVIEKATESLKDISRDDRVGNMAKALTGINVSGGSWEADVKKEIYGEKETLRYNSDWTLSSIAPILEKAPGLSKIVDEYTKIEAGVNKYKKETEDKLSKTEKSFAEKNKSLPAGAADSDPGKTEIKRQTAVSAYYNAYLAVINDTYSTISRVKQIKLDYEKAKNAQAKQMFAKMLSYKGKKDNNDASDFEDVEDFEIEL